MTRQSLRFGWLVVVAVLAVLSVQGASHAVQGLLSTAYGSATSSRVAITSPGANTLSRAAAREAADRATQRHSPWKEMQQETPSYEVLHEFGSEAGRPRARLLQGTDRNLYGTSDQGGFSGQGSVFVLTLGGDGDFTFMTLYSFTGTEGANPYAGLIQATDGYFYGTTSAGGTGGYGTVFKVDDAGNLTTLHSFIGNDGANPYGDLIQFGGDGYFYGTTYAGGASNKGTIFKMDAAGNVTTLHSFNGADGANPTAGLIQGTGGFWGTTYAGGGSGVGTIFRMDEAGNVTMVHSFTGSDGIYPYADLLQATDGNLYGTTYAGGSGYGTVFRMDIASLVVTTLHSFSSSEGSNPYGGLIQGVDGYLYGTINRWLLAGGELGGPGAVFKMNTAGSTTILHRFAGSDGANPQAGVVQHTDGNFYGTTYAGGSAGIGTVFKMDGAGNVTVLHSFEFSEASSPQAGLIQTTDGNFYGTTAIGGRTYGSGTVFKMDVTGSITILHAFTRSDGEQPHGVLIQGTDGYFYGTTSGGGPGGVGTVFRIDGAGAFQSFGNPPGAHPEAGLIQGMDGLFYGTTAEGGGCVGHCGTVFKMDDTGNKTLLHSFASSDGSHPYAGLIQAAEGNGYFYGTTYAGGASGGGTVFRMDAAGNVTTLHSFSFTGGDGAAPRAGLIQVGQDTFCGTTERGGANDKGTVFKIYSDGGVTVLHSFDWSDGAYPEAGVIQGTDGYLYGTTTSGGPNDKGTVFKMDVVGNVTTLHSFTGNDAPSYGALTFGLDGYLYGTTTRGGAGNGGYVFRLLPVVPTPTPTATATDTPTPTPTPTDTPTDTPTNTPTSTPTPAPASISLSISPTSVVGGVSATGRVTLSSPAPPGGISVTLASSDTNAATVPPSVTVAAGTTSKTFTVTTKPVAAQVPVTISASYNNYTSTALLTVNPAVLSSLTVSPASVIGGKTSNGKVTLNGKAPSGGAVVALASADLSASVPATVRISSGSTTATFTITTTPVATTVGPFNISAGYQAGTLTAPLTVQEATASKLTVSPSSVVGGTPSNGTVTLTGAAPAGGAVVALASANAAATVSASVTVSGGATTATFPITTTPVSVSTGAFIISATYNGVTKTDTLTVKAPAVLSLALNPTTVTGGTTSVGTVTLNGPAPTGGTSVTLKSSNTAVATVPGTVTVTANNTTATFNVTTFAVPSSSTARISATAGGSTKTATLTVTP